MAIILIDYLPFFVSVPKGSVFMKLRKKRILFKNKLTAHDTFTFPPIYVGAPFSFSGPEQPLCLL